MRERKTRVIHWAILVLPFAWTLFYLSLAPLNSVFRHIVKTKLDGHILPAFAELFLYTFYGNTLTGAIIVFAFSAMLIIILHILFARYIPCERHIDLLFLIYALSFTIMLAFFAMQLTALAILCIPGGCIHNWNPGLLN